MPHDAIENTLRAEDDPAKVVDVLVKLALDHGGPDNVTVLVIDVGG